MAKMVLIVEDNELDMKLFNNLLDANGFGVLQAINGKEAFSKAKEHHPDLIIMDVQLPEASSLEVTQCIKAGPSTDDIPVVAVSALAMKGDEEKVLSVGCAPILPIRLPSISFLRPCGSFWADGEVLT